MELPERFWNKVKMPDDIGKCWLWAAARGSGGYGNFYLNKKYLNAHKASYESQYGKTDEDIDHTCHVRLCVNPMHLEAVTRRENIHRSPNTNRNFCRRGGHEYTEQNTYWQQGVKVCRRCQYERHRRTR